MENHHGITFTKLRAKGKYENEARNIHVILNELAQAKMPKDLLITIWSCNELLRMGNIGITHCLSWSRRIDKYHIEASAFFVSVECAEGKPPVLDPSKERTTNR